MFTFSTIKFGGFSSNLISDSVSGGLLRRATGNFTSFLFVWSGLSLFCMIGAAWVRSFPSVVSFCDNGNDRVRWSAIVD